MKNPMSPPGAGIKKQTVPIRVDELLARKIRAVAASLGMSAPEYVHDRLIAVVAKDLPAALESMSALSAK